MSIEFQEDTFGTRVGVNFASQNQKTGSKMGDWLIKKGLVKDASSANVILILGALLFFGVSIYFFVFGFTIPQRQPASQEIELNTNLEN